MIFKGNRYTHSKKVVAMPPEMWRGTRNYVNFGRVCPKDTPGAVKTRYTYSKEACDPKEATLEQKSPQGDPPEQREDGEWYFPVYAVSVRPDRPADEAEDSHRGYSLTNLMYCADGYAYLMLDGKFYVRKLQKAKQPA